MSDTFVVLDGDVEIFRGAAGPTCKFIHMSHHRMYSIAGTDELTRQGYRVVIDNTHRKCERYYIEVRERLEKFGNTIFCHDYKYVLSRLDEDGIDVFSEKRKDDYGTHMYLEVKR